MRMSPPTSSPRAWRFSATDLKGLAQLVTSGTVAVSRIAEGVHQSVWDRLGVRNPGSAGQTKGLTGFVYRSVRGVANVTGRGVHYAIDKFAPDEHLPAQVTPTRDAWVAVLNGVMGDQLVSSQNPLATPMQFRLDGERVNLQRPLAKSTAPRDVVLFVHGLCMNEHGWDETFVARIAEAARATVVHLRYNSGRHVSENAADLAAALESLAAKLPTKRYKLTVIAHSMGGLGIRGAVAIAQEAGQAWPARLKRIVFLGTPHHGAPLERAGHQLHHLLAATPYTAPFVRLASLRSAGITDLRYGFVAAADWLGRDRFRRTPDRRQIVPLPTGVKCFAVAATLAGKRSPIAQRLLGDGLVSLDSALGRHQEASRSLVFAADQQWIAYGTSHMQLLSSAAVCDTVCEWLRKP
jgi:pimeloyl-ACP methyl ester carboxylesterase